MWFRVQLSGLKKHKQPVSKGHVFIWLKKLFHSMGYDGYSRFNLVLVYRNHIMFAHALCRSQIEYFRNTIDFNRKDRAKPPARRGCSAYASESDTTTDRFQVQGSRFEGYNGLNLIIILIKIRNIQFCPLSENAQ